MVGFRGNAGTPLRKISTLQLVSILLDLFQIDQSRV